MTKEERREYQRQWRMNNPNKVLQYCKEQKEYTKEYRTTHQGALVEQKRKWRSQNKDKVQKHTMKYNLKKLYGITPEQYTQLLLKQNGCCAICNKPSTDYKRRLHVDHDHTTKKIRGLLCVRCNYGIGYFNENTSLLDKAKEYLNTTT
jgi:hypothetical protein